MANPVNTGTPPSQDEINAQIEKASASVLGMVMMDIVSEITKDMQSES